MLLSMPAACAACTVGNKHAAQQVAMQQHRWNWQHGDVISDAADA
jgi:hypothetical protein